jgi:hypothetical protein
MYKAYKLFKYISNTDDASLNDNPKNITTDYTYGN